MGIFALVTALAISIPLGISSQGGGEVEANWTQLGDPWGGNQRAAAYNGVPAPPQQLFPLHQEGVTSFTMEHRCPATCVTDYSTTCTDERQLSNSIFAQGPQENIPDPRGLSTFAWAMGQFVDHDVTKVRQETEGDPFCTISLADLGPSVDPMVIQRTLVEVGADSCRNPRMFITPYLDGTPWYGDYLDAERAMSLREFTLGKLRLTPEGYLPRDPANPREFLAGDTRASEHVVLTLMHTVFARQHNQVAQLLHDAVPSWSDEQLYWKARRIVIAQYQRIIYEEWLPALMGSFYSQTSFGLEGVAAACADGRDVQGTTLLKTEFAQSAFRFGHSMVANNLGDFPLTSLFFNASKFEDLGPERIIADSVATASQKIDAKVVNTLRNILFGTHGLDLVTFNLARDREIGVADFAATVACYSDNPHALRHQRSQGHVDLFTGLLEEALHPGSSMPRQLGVIVGSQFLDLCRADPFFYTKVDTLKDIGRRFYPMVTDATLKGILVNTTDADPASIPDNVFFLPQ
jgi:peroxidase